MKTIRIALTALALLALLGQGAVFAEVWQQQQITSGPAQWRGSPQVWGDTVYYTEAISDWIFDAMVWTQAEGSRRLIEHDGISRGVAAVWDDDLVIAYLENNKQKLYLHDSNGVDTPIATGAGDMQNASMYAQTVVYENHQAGAPSQVWIFDPVNGSRPIHPTSSRQSNPRIWGDQVVYEDDRAGRTDVYLWNPRDGERKLSTYIYGMVSPAIYQDRVVMWILASSGYNSDAGLWEWTPTGGLNPLVSGQLTLPPYHMHAWGDIIVWSGNGSPSNVIAWDPVHGTNRLNSVIGHGSSPSIFQNKVAWVGDYDIYLSTLVPEPSGIIALFMPACLLWPALRMKRRR